MQIITPSRRHLSPWLGVFVRLPIYCATALVLAGVYSSNAAESASTNASARVVSSPPTDRRNEHYVSNRAPLTASPLVQLPIKAITPRGWLRKQLKLQADGFHGHFGEISRFLVKEDNSWLDPKGQGEHGWEEVPYWLKGYAHCAYILENPEFIKEAQIWIEGALASQRPDGWFGPIKAKATVTSTGGERDLWPNMIMLFCLQSYYDYSHDARVLELMKRYARWQLGYLTSQPDRGADRSSTPFSSWQQQRAGDALWNVYWLYNRTGDAWLLDLAREIQSWSADWTHGIASAHNVNITQGFDTPTIFWQQSREPEHLAAADRNWQSVRAEYGQVPGGMFGADEQYRPGYTGPRQAIETCGIVEEMLSDEQLLQVTGDPKWADRAEDAAYNSLTAALTADLKAVRYLTAPNQPQSDSDSKSPGIRNGGAMYEMSPSRYRCCQHNFGHGWPYFASSLWFATSDNGLAAVFYNESDVTAKVGRSATEVKISETTHYPFDEKVHLKFTSSAEVQFPLYLRIPGWCVGPQVKVNGNSITVERATAQPGEGTAQRGYVVLDRTWRNGDEIEVVLPMQIKVREWKKNQNSISIDRGPLTYSLKIKEDYRYADGSSNHKWPSWNVLPASPWNYALVVDKNNPTSSFEMVTRDWPTNDMPFTHEGSPLLIKAKGRRIPEWQLDQRHLVEEIQASPVKTSEPIEALTLIPMGAARLRISAFPVVGDGPDAHQWTALTHPASKTKK